jgi:alpha-tubulin suppressor-like RCC1 family protein
VFIAGLNNDNPNSLITFIQLPEKCTDIACGENLALILTKSGFVYSIDLDFNECFHSVKVKELETEFVIKIACNRY